MTASIVGWAHTPFGKFDTETVESLVVKVATDALADAGISAGDVDETRSVLVAALGSEAMTDAAAVIAGFDAITRVADGSGIPLEPPKAEATAGWRASLGIDAYWSQKV